MSRSAGRMFCSALAIAQVAMVTALRSAVSRGKTGQWRFEGEPQEVKLDGENVEIYKLTDGKDTIWTRYSKMSSLASMGSRMIGKMPGFRNSAAKRQEQFQKVLAKKQGQLTQQEIQKIKLDVTGLHLNSHDGDNDTTDVDSVSSNDSSDANISEFDQVAINSVGMTMSVDPSDSKDIIISRIHNGSVAAAMGLKVGDRISQVKIGSEATVDTTSVSPISLSKQIDDYMTTDTVLMKLKDHRKCPPELREFQGKTIRVSSKGKVYSTVYLTNEEGILMRADVPNKTLKQAFEAEIPRPVVFIGKRVDDTFNFNFKAEFHRDGKLNFYRGVTKEEQDYNRIQELVDGGKTYKQIKKVFKMETKTKHMQENVKEFIFECMARNLIAEHVDYPAILNRLETQFYETGGMLKSIAAKSNLSFSATRRWSVFRRHILSVFAEYVLEDGSDGAEPKYTKLIEQLPEHQAATDMEIRVQSLIKRMAKAGHHYPSIQNATKKFLGLASNEALSRSYTNTITRYIKRYENSAIVSSSKVAIKARVLKKYISFKVPDKQVNIHCTVQAPQEYAAEGVFTQVVLDQIRELCALDDVHFKRNEIESIIEQNGANNENFQAELKTIVAAHSRSQDRESNYAKFDAKFKAMFNDQKILIISFAEDRDWTSRMNGYRDIYHRNKAAFQKVSDTKGFANTFAAYVHHYKLTSNDDNDLKLFMFEHKQSAQSFNERLHMNSQVATAASVDTESKKDSQQVGFAAEVTVDVHSKHYHTIDFIPDRDFKQEYKTFDSVRDWFVQAPRSELDATEPVLVLTTEPGNVLIEEGRKRLERHREFRETFENESFPESLEVFQATVETAMANMSSRREIVEAQSDIRMKSGHNKNNEDDIRRGKELQKEAEQLREDQDELNKQAESFKNFFSDDSNFDQTVDPKKVRKSLRHNVEAFDRAANYQKEYAEDMIKLGYRFKLHAGAAIYKVNFRGLMSSFKDNYVYCLDTPDDHDPNTYDYYVDMTSLWNNGIRGKYFSFFFEEGIEFQVNHDTATIYPSVLKTLEDGGLLKNFGAQVPELFETNENVGVVVKENDNSTFARFAGAKVVSINGKAINNLEDIVLADDKPMNFVLVKDDFPDSEFVDLSEEANSQKKSFDDLRRHFSAPLRKSTC